MEKCLFPLKYLYITQKMNVGTHKGTKAIDCGYRNEEDKKVYAPFTGTIVQIYGDQHSVWLQSNDKIMFADGTTGYATARFIHDNDVSDLKVGKVIKQGELFYKMGNAGNATGVHVHLEISKGHVKGYKSKNKYGNWEMPNTINIYDGYILKDDTEVKNTKGYIFKYEKDMDDSRTQKFNIGDEVIINGNLYKSSNADKASGVVKAKKTTITRYAKGTKHPYNTTGDLGWMNEEDIKPLQNNELNYIVKKGDNLTTIAKKYNTTWQKIYNDNRLIIGSNPNIIKVGQKLIIK
ncbi:MAG: M23 family metallopeptidase [Clostridium sp.]|nr:M23 family metallopeptidase [Clostridium sp.]MCM1444373.1 M23 family metallopeptidase [Candidatus Amulumruptor caecigallinarius]